MEECIHRRNDDGKQSDKNEEPANVERKSISIKHTSTLLGVEAQLALLYRCFPECPLNQHTAACHDGYYDPVYDVILFEHPEKQGSQSENTQSNTHTIENEFTKCCQM